MADRSLPALQDVIVDIVRASLQLVDIIWTPTAAWLLRLRTDPSGATAAKVLDVHVLYHLSCYTYVYFSLIAAQVLNRLKQATKDPSTDPTLRNMMTAVAQEPPNYYILLCIVDFVFWLLCMFYILNLGHALPQGHGSPPPRRNIHIPLPSFVTYVLIHTPHYLLAWYEWDRSSLPAVVGVSVIALGVLLVLYSAFGAEPVQQQALIPWKATCIYLARLWVEGSYTWAMVVLFVSGYNAVSVGVVVLLIVRLGLWSRWTLLETHHAAANGGGNVLRGPGAGLVELLGGSTESDLLSRCLNFRFGDLIPDNR